MESGQPSMARVLAEEAERSVTKPWHRAKLDTLKEHEVQVSGFEHRRVHSIVLGNQGFQFIDRGESHDLDPEYWFAEFVSLMELGGPGYLPDVLRVHLAYDADLPSLTRLLSATQLLPFVPLLIADNSQQAQDVQRLCRAYEDTLPSDIPTGLAVASVISSDGEGDAYDFIGFMDHALLTPLDTDRYVALELAELDARMMAAAVVWLSRQPAFRTRRSLLLEALRREGREVLPLSSRCRAFSTVLAYYAHGRERSREAEDLAVHLLGTGFYDEALGMLGDVPESRRGAYHRRRLVRALYGTARFEALCDASFDSVDSRLESALIREARAANRMIACLTETEMVPPSVVVDPVPDKVVSILHASQPWQSGGYANRAHQILRALGDRGIEVVAYTRPGFPEADNELSPGEIHAANYDRVAYRRIGTDNPRHAGEYTYMEESVSYYREILLKERPSVVHLRSTYVSALPGCIAAKSLGLPVVYEVSGMWELVYESKNGARMEGRRARTVALENAVLKAADAVSTLTGAMRDIIEDRVTPTAPVTILPNAVDAARFAPRPKSDKVRAELEWYDGVPVIGYAGTFVDYEGLDVLMRALSILRSRGIEFRALMIGDGAVHGQIVSLAEDLGLSGWVHFTGRVPHSEVDDLYSVVDICAYPRRWTPATVAVSPLKPFEAMAAEKIVLVSDVPALAEIAGDNERAMVFRHDDPQALAEALESVIVAPSEVAQMRKRSRTWVEQERSWDAVGDVFAELLTRTSLKGQTV